VRRGQAAGDFHRGLDPHDVAAVLVGAFDGLKSLTDVLDPGAEATGTFTRRADALLAMVEHGLVTAPPTRD
jgi:hypothetical protein